MWHIDFSSVILLFTQQNMGNKTKAALTAADNCSTTFTISIFVPKRDKNVEKSLNK